MSSSSESAVEFEVYRNLILDRLSANKGMFFENVVAQQLVSSGHHLVFSKFKSGEKNYEVDFHISRKNKVVPIEVKSAQFRSHRSLDKFREKYPSIIGESYVIYSNDLKQENGVTYLPVYMTLFL